MNIRSSLSVFFALSFLISCSTSKRVTHESISFDELLKKYKSNFESINSIYASGTISLSTKNFPVKLEFEMITLKDNRAVIDLWGPLGIYVGNLYLNDDSIMIHNNFNNKLIYTSFKSNKLRKFLSDDINKKMIYSLLLGYINPDQIDSDSSSAIIDSGNFYLLSKFKEDRKIVFYFDKKYWMISEINILKEDKLISNVSLTDFIQTEDDYRFPTKIKLHDLRTNNSIEINISGVEFNKENFISYPSMPDGVEIEKW